MPISLPPLTRRQFLRRAALAGATFALAPNAFPGFFSPRRDPHTFALLSDTHIAADAGLISRNVNMAGNLATVAREILALPQKPHAVVVNGDLAFKSGLPGDYATLGRLIDAIRAGGLPVHLSLGNHDNRENFWQVFPAEATTRRPLYDRQTAVLSTPRANWFLLDSLDTTDSTPGLLGTKQLEWLESTLAARSDRPAILIAHHNLQTGGLVAGLKDSAAFAELFVRHRHLKAFIFGHTHNWNITQNLHGVHLINLPPVAYVFKEARPSGWVRATVTRGGMELELRCVNPSHPEHGQVQQLRWR